MYNIDNVFNRDIDESPTYCNDCGSAIKDNDEICLNCGEKNGGNK